MAPPHLCLDPRVKPEDDGVWGSDGILLHLHLYLYLYLHLFHRTAHEEDALFHSRKVVILGLDPRIQTQAFEGQTVTSNHSISRKKGDDFGKIPNKIKPRHVFSSPPISTLVDSSPSRPRIHLTMRCQARRGRRRGGALSQV